MQSKIDDLYKDHAKLRTTAKTRPGLFLTEFGYLNRPETAKAKLQAVHQETERSTWYASALSLARRNHARAFVMWILAEDPTKIGGDPVHGIPPTPTYRLKDANKETRSFDTGIMGSTLDGADFGAVVGLRQYGKGPPGHAAINTPQQRKAYCRVRRWARDAGLLVSGTDCP